MSSFVIYVAVQILAYSVDYTSYLAFYFYGHLDPVVANCFSKALAGLVAFFLHRRFTFQANVGTSVWRQASLYFLSLLLNIPLGSALLWLFLLCGIGPLPAKVIADGCGLLANFTISRSVTFRTRKV